MPIKALVIDGDDDRFLIKKKGYFDLHKLYADVYKWFIEKKYEFQETDHKYKATNPLGEEHELNIYGWRKENDFIKWEIRLNFMIWDLIPVVMEINGEKKRLYQGRMRVELLPYFVFDFGNYFEKTPFLRKLRNVFMTKIIKRKYQIEGDKFEYEYHELMELIKKDLNMYNAGNQFAHYWK